MSAQLSGRWDPDIKALSDKLKAQDSSTGGRLKKDLAKAMRDIGTTVVQAEQAAIRGATIRGVKRGGKTRFKRGGSTGSGKGIRNNIAASIVRRNRITAKEQGIEVQTSGSKMPAGMNGIPFKSNSGSWRHPIFGNRKAWAAQTVSPAGWWTKTADELKPKIETDVRKVVEDFTKQLQSDL